ncbi:cyclin-dependent kinases regulatory subunit 1 [Caerostris extrusa]|uniref:Cyclin-dependent kinases regulatory subunit n=1 Tax=Caerostris extrusa TaxID=172846 RepID=A0AAV4XYC3_CAEEX|nr:cyclin-dependent kinases regulatory subunit 1 [Caerostris extrusa]
MKADELENNHKGKETNEGISFSGFEQRTSILFYLYDGLLSTTLRSKHVYKMTRDNIFYSDKYTDDKYEYRHVILPPELAELVPRTHLMTETEWRNLGVQQSPYWRHYMVHSQASA